MGSMSENLSKELSRLQLLNARYKNKLRMCPLEIKKEEMRAFIIFDYIKQLQQENQQLKSQLEDTKKECLNQRKTFHEKLGVAEKIAQKYQDRYYNEQLNFKKQLKQRDDVIDKAKKFVKEFQESFDCYDDVYKDMNILLSILNKRGGTDE